MPKGIGYGPKPPGTKVPGRKSGKVSLPVFRRRRPKPPGRKPGMGKKLTPIRRKVVTKRPRRM